MAILHQLNITKNHNNGEVLSVEAFNRSSRALCCTVRSKYAQLVREYATIKRKAQRSIKRKHSNNK